MSITVEAEIICCEVLTPECQGALRGPLKNLREVVHHECELLDSDKAVANEFRARKLESVQASEVPHLELDHSRRLRIYRYDFDDTLSGAV